MIFFIDSTFNNSTLIFNNNTITGATEAIGTVNAAASDKTALTTAISYATTLLASNKVGTAVGNVSQYAYKAYYLAIVKAMTVNSSTSLTAAQEDVAVATLATATTNFNNSVITNDSVN